MEISKYNSSGNDFIIFYSDEKKDWANIAKILCEEKSGIGADGMIIIKKHPSLDFQWEFYNKDGSKAKMCGNGSRAAAMFAYKNNLAKENMSFLTKAGIIKSQIIKKINEHKFIVKTSLTDIEKLNEAFISCGKKWFFYDSGVPHLVSFVDDIDKMDLKLARFLRKKYNANVNFAKIEDNKLKVRTYERGVEGETLACGTGMSACFYALNKDLNIKNVSQIVPKSQEVLNFYLEDEKISFEGEVFHSFDAKYHLL